MATEATFNVATPQGRRWRRCEFTALVRVTIEKSRRLLVINARGSEMNNGGLAVEADTELTVGDEAEFRFMPPHFYPFVSLRGVIRDLKGGRYGVEFVSTSAAEAKRLGLFRQSLAQWSAGQRWT